MARRSGTYSGRSSRWKNAAQITGRPLVFQISRRSSMVVLGPIVAWKRPRPDSPIAFVEREELRLVREPARHRQPAVAHVRLGGGRPEADRARDHRLAHEAAHRGHFLGGGHAVLAVAAHHPLADRRVAEQRGHVEARVAALEVIEVLRERLEAPGDAGAHGGQRHALDLHQRAHDQVAVGGAAGRDGEAAVADDGGGDAVPDAAGGIRVPRVLGVVVGVDVDEAGGDHEAARVDLARAALADLADRADAPVLDGHVGPPPRLAAAVHHGAAANHEIGHVVLFRAAGSCRPQFHPAGARCIVPAGRPP